MKSKTFSIYLLKIDFTPDNALKNEHPLGSPIQATKLPPGSRMYLLDSIPHPPWWKDYWGVIEQIKQSLKGAIVFIPNNDRFFALTFGYTYHYLKEHAYEYDFGLRITLNSIDPNALKSTDILNPENSLRQRIQSPTGSDITFFNFDRDSSIIRHLAGKVKNEYKGLFSSITGASNLSINIKKTPNEIPDLLSQLLTLYNKDSYKQSFPDIHNIIPLHDPEVIDKLNKELMKAFYERHMKLVLSIPDITDPDNALNIYFSGAGQKQGIIYQDVYIDYYREYLANNSKTNITINDLNKHSMNICDDDGTPKRSYSIFKSLLFDCQQGNEHFHLCEGIWYQIDNSYLERLKNFLDPYFYDDNSLPKYRHESEEDYNASITGNDVKYICLDRTNISPPGQSAVEPCDIYTVDEKSKTAIFYHVKLSTRSSTLSHLFNQGLNSIELLRLNDYARNKIKELIKKSTSGKSKNQIEAIDNDNLRVVYVIITKKKNADKSLNLPLFSRISLKRCLNTLKLMKIDAKICFIENLSEKKPSKPKERKRKNKNKQAISYVQPQPSP